MTGVDIISVMSDGAKSFLKNDAYADETLLPIPIIEEWNAFKNTNGVFVERRMKAFVKKCKAEDIHHYDDISIASIVVA